MTKYRLWLGRAPRLIQGIVWAWNRHLPTREGLLAFLRFLEPLSNPPQVRPYGDALLKMFAVRLRSG
jgi:hypothetical protein